MHRERPPLALQLVLLGKHVDYLLEHRLANHGLNRTQTVVLIVLRRRPGLQALDLCRPAGVEPANVTRTLQSLERMGLLERKPHPTDGRAHLFYLTDAGLDLAGELSEDLHAVSTILVGEEDHEGIPEMEKLLDRLWQVVGDQLSAINCRQAGAARSEDTAGGNGRRRHRHLMSHVERQRAES